MAKRIDSITLPGGLLGIKKFTASGSYVPAANVKKFIVEMVGAGGGSTGVPPGSTATDSLSGGGGSGGYVKFLVDLSEGFLEGASYVIAIGAGGTGNVSAGTDGSPSQFTYRRPNGTTDAYAILYGGMAAALQAVPTTTTFARALGGTGGFVNTGTFAGLTVLVSRGGEVGKDGLCTNRTLVAGMGGAGIWSRGGNVGVLTADGYGGGGTGIARPAGVATASGAGAGSQGMAILWEYA